MNCFAHNSKIWFSQPSSAQSDAVVTHTYLKLLLFEVKITFCLTLSASVLKARSSTSIFQSIRWMSSLSFLFLNTSSNVLYTVIKCFLQSPDHVLDWAALKTNLRKKVTVKTTRMTPPTAQTTTMMTMSSCAKKISQTYTYSNCSLLKHACKCRYMYMHMHMCIRTCMNQPYTFLIHWFVWTELAVEATGRSVGRRQSVLRTPVHAHIAQLRHLLRHNTTSFYLC